jgi:hypothetical protein
VGRVAIQQYSRNQYAWKPAGERGHPVRSDPPHRFTARGGMPVTLPAYSLTVLQGRIVRAATMPSRPLSRLGQASLSNAQTSYMRPALKRLGRLRQAHVPTHRRHPTAPAR